ncbi:MAG: diphosphomevalonate decarboxylase [Bdellovibrionaceae bacterium]|nr:diphosphomevalonate decarboxylase [Pseudobdellovibrionaceae bacterium]
MNSHIYSAPSNIAIIKYMGKTSTQQNLPTNPSISYTLEHLRSFVSIDVSGEPEDSWEPLTGTGFLPIELSEKGKLKFLNHLKRIKKLWGVNQNFRVRSANNFPSDCGIASSSSSFAALTLAAVSTFEKMNPGAHAADSLEMSKISRLGSGSSCRSFFAPWAIWKTDGAQAWQSSFKNMDHSVMLLDSSKKEVSSSDAHVRVVSSPLFIERLRNVNKRLLELEMANKNADWNTFARLAADEFEEMHQLFETSNPPFSYRSEKTKDVLKHLHALNRELNTSVLITMDAGNNIHIMSLTENRKDIESIEKAFPSARFINSWQMAGDRHV